MKRWHFVIIVLFSVLMMSRQFLLGDHFDRYGGDLHGHLHRTWWVNHMLEDGEFTFWNHFENFGSPVPFLYPFTAYLSYIPALLVMGVKDAFKFTNLLLYIFGGVGCYKLAQSLKFSGKGALFGSILYIIHPWTSSMNIFHATPVTILSFALLPLIALLYRKKDWRYSILLGLNLWVHVYNSAFLILALPFFRRPEKKDFALGAISLLLFSPYLFAMSTEINLGPQTFFQDHIFEGSKMKTYSYTLSDLFSPLSYPHYVSIFLEYCPLSETLCKASALPLAKFITLFENPRHDYQGLFLTIIALAGISVKKKFLKKMALGMVFFYLFLFFGPNTINLIFENVPFFFRAFEIGRTFHVIRLFVALSAGGVLAMIKKNQLAVGLLFLIFLDVAPAALSFGFDDFTHAPFCDHSFETSFWLQENNNLGFYTPLNCPSLEVEKNFNLRPIEVQKIGDAVREKDLGTLGSLGMRFWIVRKDRPIPGIESYDTVFEASDVLVIELDYLGRAYGDTCDVNVSLISNGLSIQTVGDEKCVVKVNQFWFSGWVGNLDEKDLQLNPLPDNTFSFKVPAGEHKVILLYDFEYLRKRFN